MATAALKPDKRPQKLPAGLPPKALMRWGTFLRFFAPVVQEFKLSLDGVDPMEFPGGAHLKPTPKADDFLWKITITEGDDGLVAHIEEGMYNGFVVGPWDLPIAGTGTEWVTFQPIHPLGSAFTFVFDYEYAGGDAVIVVSTPAGKRESTTGHDYSIIIGKIVDGNVAKQYVKTPLVSDIRDASGSVEDGGDPIGRLFWNGQEDITA